MRLTFTYIIRPNKTQDKIIKELMWHSSKVYNMLNYNVKEGKEKINTNGILNVEGSRIYKKYRKENWHSEYVNVKIRMYKKSNIKMYKNVHF